MQLRGTGRYATRKSRYGLRPVQPSFLPQVLADHRHENTRTIVGPIPDRDGTYPMIILHENSSPLVSCALFPRISLDPTLNVISA